MGWYRRTNCTCVAQISQFMLDMQQVRGACKPDVLLVYELYADEQARRLLYPFNVLRNLARLQVGAGRGRSSGRAMPAAHS